MRPSRREFLRHLGWGTAALASGCYWGCGGTPTRSSSTKPNIIVIFADDLGYGDLGIFGNPTIRTPRLDRMASEGQKWTSFYSACSVCTPSRAALLTGRLPIRSGMCSDTNRVLFPNSTGGLPDSEVTLAEALKSAGYATACVGKWHLGHHPPYLPTRHGFDSYFGIPYSNDMDSMGIKGAFADPKSEYWNVPLMRNEDIVERPAMQESLTRRYTEEAVSFINSRKDRPFFLYLAHTFPHVPLFRSQEFSGRSLRGPFGDVIEEIDWSTGRILDTLRELGLDRSTLVVFTSDNGPWLSYHQQGGFAGLLRGGKGSTFEGGMREPTLFWWPGRVSPGVEMDLGSTLDIFPTACGLAGADVPSDRAMDGFDLRPALLGDSPSPRDIMYFYRGTRIFAVRKGPYKAHFITRSGYGPDQEAPHDPPLLYHLGHDPAEKFNIAENHPDVIEDILQEVETHRQSVIPVKNQLDERI
jgi:arylsulfatase A